MADSSQGTGNTSFDKKKRSWPNELNILIALIIIIAIFEALGQTLPYMKDQSFLFDTVNGGLNPKAVFGPWAFDLPVLIPVLVALLFGAMIGAINGSLIAFTRIPPFIATLGMFLICRGIAQAWTRGKPVSFPTEGYASLGSGMMPVFGLWGLLWSFTAY